MQRPGAVCDGEAAARDRGDGGQKRQRREDRPEGGGHARTGARPEDSRLSLPAELQGLEPHQQVAHLLEENARLREREGYDRVEAEARLRQVVEAQRAVSATKRQLAEQELTLEELVANSEKFLANLK